MTLTDTGPLVALLSRRDPNHGVCAEAAKRLPEGPLLTTWPCFTEAMHLLSRSGGFRSQAELWRMRATTRLHLHDLTAAEMDRMAVLMAKYADQPMDLADASLNATAEQLHLRRLFTLDSDFYVYRLADGSTLELIP